MKTFGAALIFLSCVVPPVLATETPPPAQVTEAPSTTTTATTTESTTTPPASAPTTPTPATTTTAAADSKPPFKVPPEYKRRVVNGQVSYCTKTTTLGSRFPKTICVDEEGLRTLVELRNSNQDDLRRAQSACTSSASCGGS